MKDLNYFLLISSKKFHAKTISVLFLFFIADFVFIGILTPGINLLCFNLLSSTIKSISFFIPKKFKAVVAFAGAPYPTINLLLSLSFLIFFLTFSLILYIFLQMFGMFYIF